MKRNTGGKKRGREETVDCNSREQRFKMAREELNYRSCLCVQSKASLRVDFGPAEGGPVRVHRPMFGLGCCLLQKNVGRTCPIDLQHRVD